MAFWNRSATPVQTEPTSVIINQPADNPPADPPVDAAAIRAIVNEAFATAAANQAANNPPMPPADNPPAAPAARRPISRNGIIGGVLAATLALLAFFLITQDDDKDSDKPATLTQQDIDKAIAEAAKEKGSSLTKEDLDKAVADAVAKAKQAPPASIPPAGGSTASSVPGSTATTVAGSSKLGSITGPYIPSEPNRNYAATTPIKMETKTITLAAGEAVVVEGYIVDGVEGGTYLMHCGPGTWTHVIKDGAVSVVSMANAEAEFDARLAIGAGKGQMYVTRGCTK